VIGWAFNDNRTVIEYGRALNENNLTATEITPQIRQQLAAACNKDYLGLSFVADDFLLTSGEATVSKKAHEQ
jgi:hypothetical protein